MHKSVLVALLSCLAITPVAARGDVEPPPIPRVRPHDSRAANLLLAGLDRSATVRDLLERIERHDVLVYVEMQPAMRRRLAGRLTWLTSAARFRYVRISLNPELSRETLIAVLGHELQHALEVALTPTIVDETTLEAHYRRHGIEMKGHNSGWDTQAARDTGELVRREIADRPARAGDTVAAFDPEQWYTVYRRARDQSAARQRS